MTNDNGNAGPAARARFAQSLAGLSEECILRVRRGSIWWEGSNRGGIATAAAGAGPYTRAFRTASVTKTFTAAVVLLLAEEGALAIDDAVAAYLPSGICERIHILDGISYGPRISIAQLLGHRSGLFDYATDPRFAARIAGAPSKLWSPLDLLNEALEDRLPYFRPGEGLAYSDTGYVLLGMIIEGVTGATLAAAYKKYLTDPLALKHTYLEGKEAPVDWPVSHAFAGAVDTFGLDPSFDTFGGGGLVSTAADLDSFITRLLSGAVFARDATLGAMMAGTDAAPGSGTRKTRSAAGLSAFSIAEQRFWGHLGHWNSFMLHSIEEDISICGTFNQADEDPRQKRILEAAAIEARGWQK
ncbi:MAG: serine hydrolase domain-containing protein [Sterolibacterium sp.]